MIRSTLVFAVVVIMAGAGVADTITVLNPSFESPALDPGGWGYQIDDWSGPDPAAQEAFLEHIVGFVADGTNHLGLQTGIEVWQDLTVPALPNTTYTLNVAVGNRDNGWNPAGSEARYGLYTGGSAQGGGTLLGDDFFDASTIPESSFADQELIVTTGDVVPAGNLVLSLQSTGPNRTTSTTLV